MVALLFTLLDGLHVVDLSADNLASSADGCAAVRVRALRLLVVGIKEYLLIEQSFLEQVIEGLKRRGFGAAALPASASATTTHSAWVDDDGVDHLCDVVPATGLQLARV